MTLLKDKGLMEKLEQIEKASDDTVNPYDNKEAALEYAEMCDKLKKVKTTNLFKENLLLSRLFSKKEVSDLFFDETLNKLIEEYGYEILHYDKFITMSLKYFDSDPNIMKFYEDQDLHKIFLDLKNYAGNIDTSEVLNQKLLAEDAGTHESYSGGIASILLRDTLQKYFDNMHKINVIDLGSGDGGKANTTISHFKPRFLTYLPLDISPYMGAIALNTVNENVDCKVEVINSLDCSKRQIGKVVEENLEERIEKLSGVIDRVCDLSSFILKISMRERAKTLRQYCSKEREKLVDKYMTDADRIKLSKYVADHYSLLAEGKSKIYHLSFDYLKNMSSEERDMHDLCHFNHQFLDAPEVLFPNARYEFDKLLENKDETVLFSLERYLDLMSPFLKYLEDYFKEFNGFLNNKKFYKALKSNPGGHISMFLSFFLDCKFEDTGLMDARRNFFNLTHNENYYLVMYGCLSKLDFGIENIPDKLDYHSGRCKSELGKSIGNHYIHADRNQRNCFVPEDSITIDFFDFDKVSTSMKYLTSVSPGKNIFMLLGQTLGNYSEDERAQLVKQVYDNLNEGDYFLVGVDIKPDGNLSDEYIKQRIQEMEWEYKQGEGFARLVSKGIPETSEYIPIYNSETHSMDINFKHESGEIETVFNSYKFENDEVENLLVNSGFKLEGLEPFFPDKEEAGVEYIVYLARKVEK
jgi:hypothetical protein